VVWGMFLRNKNKFGGGDLEGVMSSNKGGQNKCRGRKKRPTKSQ